MPGKKQLLPERLSPEVLETIGAVKQVFRGTVGDLMLLLPTHQARAAASAAIDRMIAGAAGYARSATLGNLRPHLCDECKKKLPD